MILFQRAVIITLIISYRVRKCMESAADPDAKPKLPSLFVVLEEINKKRRSVTCSCDVLAKKVEKYYLKVDPNYLSYGIDFHPCCVFCCNCHADKFDEDLHYNRGINYEY